MIGVAVQPSERAAAQEFFELCKVPWEFWTPGRRYRAVLSSGAVPELSASDLMLVFASTPTSLDQAPACRVLSSRTAARLRWGEQLLPIYGRSLTFHRTGETWLTDATTGAAAFCHYRTGTTLVARIGYDLFAEVEALLGAGQPVQHAAVPTLDLHVALVRDLIVRGGVKLLEIPPVPEGHAFVACLTHDVDHPVLANHRFDHTMFGFLHRATVGSVTDVVTGRRKPQHLWQNWVAVAQLPLLHLKLAKDPWREFVRYAEYETGLRSTYFVLPARGNPGRLGASAAPMRRAGGYALADIDGELRQLRAAGAELAVHGIDAWIGADDGRREQASVAAATGAQPAGVRMHWLYFGAESVTALDRAGFRYDSSIGYNETVGYRSGTAQVYRPLSATRLLELPLHIMDTALFYPSYLHLSAEAARQRIQPMIDHVAARGGVLTVNWHDRSLAAERHWGDSYLALLRELRDRGAWFPTASEAVQWFDLRRSATFASANEGQSLRVRVPASPTLGLPALRLRVHRPAPDAAAAPFRTDNPTDHFDVALTSGADLTVDL